ncbi:hypothetical protein F4V43_16460 [Paenibacillus spiritus]|uniref:Condensation domain-containing protein n=1 Tax=Paenibacillus spiritus TaxID=2496557 RepID=A0A5J5FXZ3_9BACL|nr:condensation domain-containing protein [Paenibacillus spiritus]KAA8998819.1 hypothetical protein F4V43_16460 [Paenibacillus spiritus]
MEPVRSGVRQYAMHPLHEKIVYAEKHRKNYDIYFELELSRSLDPSGVESAVEDVLGFYEALRLRVARAEDGAGYAFRLQPDEGGEGFRSGTTLQGEKLDLFGGGPLARYYYDPERGRLEFLIHHLVFDGDSLGQFAAALERRLAGGGLPSPEDAGGWSPQPPARGDEGAERQKARFREDFARAQRGREPERERLENPAYGSIRLSPEAWTALGSLAKKWRTTRFAVSAFTAALLTGQKESIAGVVVSRRDPRIQSGSVGNFTDVAPCVLRLDESAGFAANARGMLRQCLHGMTGSEGLSYGEYMELLGAGGYDFVLSYTKMADPLRESAYLLGLTLGSYLYKYDNHLQFNEYEDGLSLEFRCDCPRVRRVSEQLEPALLALDRADPDERLRSPLGSGMATDPAAGEASAQAADGSPESPGSEPLPPAAAGRTPLRSAPASSVTRTLSNLLGRGADSDLLMEVLTSFDIAYLITEAYESWGIQLTYHDVYDSHTLGDLKNRLKQLAGGAEADLEAAAALETGPPADSKLPEAPRQYRLPGFGTAIFIDSFRFLHSDLYDVRYAFRLGRDMEPGSFRRAVQETIRSNEIFFTAFAYGGGEVTATAGAWEEVELPVLELESLADLERQRKTISPRAGGALWDMKIVRAARENGWYFYLHLHHLLIDHHGIGVLLDQIAEAYRGQALRPVQYRELAEAYESEIAAAVRRWRLPEGAAAESGGSLGREGLGQGRYRLRSWTLDTEGLGPEELEYEAAAALAGTAARFFGRSSGSIGAVYHGRVIPGASRVIGSFARVLPVYFAEDDPDVLRSSLRTARLNQAASVYDLQRSGLPAAYPRIVCQILQEDSGRGGILEETVELGGWSKFQLFVNLTAGRHTGRLDFYIDDSLYTPEEGEELFRRMEEALAGRGQREEGAERHERARA